MIRQPATIRNSPRGNRPAAQVSLRPSARRLNCQLPTVNCQLSGSALIEMLTVISVAAVMMGLAVTLIHRLLEAERQALDSARSSAAVSRLASHLRDDLHAAVHVELTQSESGQPSRLVATTADGRQIRYELDQHVASRLEDLGDGQTHRDMFYFLPRTRLQLFREEEDLVRLQ